MKTIWMICGCLCIVGMSVVAADRPFYGFSDEVFACLPDFPDDFYEVKVLFETQQVTAKQLNEKYYQPEMLPGWGYWHDRIYNNSKYDVFGRYGVSMYPSRFDVFDVEQGEVFTISALMYAELGIQYIQGVRLHVMDNEMVQVDILEPREHVLLLPTYPVFELGWMQLVVLQFRILQEGETVVKVSEEKPSELQHTLWKEQYGSSYVGFNNLVSGMPRLSVYLHPPDRPVSLEDTEEQTTMLYIVGFVVVALIVLGLLYAISKRVETSF